MTQPTRINLWDARELHQIAFATGLTEDSVPFDGHRFIARRNAGDLRFQIFRDDEPTPYGIVKAHRCAHLNGDWRLRVYDPAEQTIGNPDVLPGDGHPGGACFGNYRKALEAIRAAAK